MLVARVAKTYQIKSVKIYTALQICNPSKTEGSFGWMEVATGGKLYQDL